MNAPENKSAWYAEATGSGSAGQPRTVALTSTSESSRGNTSVLRILVPINANEDSRWGVQYAVRRHREGERVEVILLNIAEPITQWQVLRFRTQQEIAEFQSERAEVFIDEAARLLAAESISYRGFFKHGDVVFAILDAAEELDCHEIAMPPPKKGLWGVFFRDIVHAVKCRQRNVPLVAVDRDGMPRRS